MISPRSTRLRRAADLRAFQRALFDCLPADPDRARDTAVIVPTRGAAEELRRTLNAFDPAAPQSPLLTRAEFYEALRARLPGSPAALSPFDREVLLRRAARAVHVAGVVPPFNLRAGLVREILGLYDDLRRHHRSVADFARLILGTLEPVAGSDRGAARLLQQTRFLAAAFEEFERTTVEGVDEHRIRAMALASPSPLFRHVVVSVADQAADAHGLWTADFDLLARLPGLESIDVVATDALLDAGYHQRLHEHLLPGIEDTRLAAPAEPPPVLLVPDADPRDPSYGAARPFVCRDREEELVDVARLVTRGARSDERSAGREAAAGDRTAVVFRRPLPYLYLARQVFGDARLSYQALDSLPLAAEPFAAAVDLLFAAIAAGFTRGALIELLRSPHFTFAAGGQAITPEDVQALDRRLVKEKYLGGIDRLSALAPQPVVDAVMSLQSAADAPTAPGQIDGLLAFIASHERLPEPDDAWFERHMRARGAVLSALEMLRHAHAQQDPERLSIAELSGAVRRWIEAQTFSPRTGERGTRLLDADAAPYADVDEARLVGLVESDWPERGTRSIFYPASLLAQLGWPADQDRLAASRTKFQDLLRLPRRRVSLSTFTLEDDAIVPPSPLLEDLEAVGLPVERLVASADASPFLHEARMREPESAAIDGEAADWLSLRRVRVFDAPRFRGMIGPRAGSVYAVSRLERYLECPFKYFAAQVLRLPEERDEEAWMTPQERGHFVHEVFEDFFAEWQRRGHGAITPDNVAAALALFDEVAERRLDLLPEGDRALERTLLLGSAAAAGFGERAFAFEIADDVAVVERLLEYELEGRFTFTGPEGPRDIALRSKSDRIDLLADGTLRIVDYKLGRAPQPKRSLQLPIYGACAAQALAGRHGRAWTVSRAGYIAFREKTPFNELQQPAKAIADGEARLIDVVDGIERGEFPVRPDEPFLCNWCPYPGVCRKDYVGDEIEK